MEELDPLVLSSYQSFVEGQGFVNEDAYAYQPDLRYGYLLKPRLRLTVQNYSSALFVDDLPPWTLASNSKGFRVNEEKAAIRKNFAETKILHVLGDSSSFGWGVNFRDSYPGRLEEKLKHSQKNPGVAVKNHSIPGFTSFQGRLMLGEMGKINKGDIVFISFGWNDSYPSLNSDRMQFQVRNSLAGKTNWFLNRLLIIKWMRTLIYSLPDPIDISAENTGSRVSLKEYRDNLNAIFKTIQKSGGKPYFVSVCNTREYRDVAEETAKGANVPFYDFPEMFKPFLPTVHERFPDKFVTYFEAYGDLMEKETMLVFLFPDLCHPNVIGHGLMGDILFESLKGEILN